VAKTYHTASIDGVPSRPDQQRNTERGAQTRDRILDAAEQIFSQRGYAAARIEDISTTVGIRKPSVIHHFTGKLELHNEVMNRIYAALLDATLEALADATDNRPAVFTIADAWLDFIASRPPAGRLFLRSAVDNSFATARVGPEARELLERWTRAVQEVVQQEEFSVTEPLELLSVFAGAALMFVSIHPWLAGAVEPASNESGLLEPYRKMLHRSLHAILSTEVR
tara:strand:- start:2910 stop:3584 length:675 start_codon:yes stop_codon:yes gene_type:complete